jgi:threonine dehydrogenase-like Zn-dependent dehydrogenase
MRALFWDGTVACVLDRPQPALQSGMARVRVQLAGICNTDLELTKGYMSFRGVLGHEFVGTVEDGPPEWRHKRVVGEINFGCGVCTLCVRGLQRHCPTRRVMGILNADGAFAEFVAVPVANLHVVPDTIPDDVAVFTEPLAAACEILEQVHVRPGTDSVVLGDGKLGLLVAQLLHRAGAHVLAVGRHEEKLGVLRRRGIATVALHSWDGDAADLVVEATGSPAAFATAVKATRPRGTLVLKSTCAAPAQLNLAPLVINEITVVGSRCGSFQPALRALATGSIDVRSLISERLPLSQGVQTLQRAASPGMLKVLLEISA